MEASAMAGGGAKAGPRAVTRSRSCPASPTTTSLARHCSRRPPSLSSTLRRLSLDLRLNAGPRERLPDQRHHFRAEQLDAAHHLRMWQRAIAVLHVESRETKNLHGIDDLGGNSFRCSDAQGSVRTGRRVE